MSQYRKKFIPQVDADLTVVLPGETLRAKVRRVVNPDTVVVELTSAPMTRSHTYRKGDIVACQRDRGLGGEIWVAVEQRRAMPRIPAEQPKKEKPMGKTVTAAAPKPKAAAKPKIAAKTPSKPKTDRAGPPRARLPAKKVPAKKVPAKTSQARARRGR